LSNGYPEYSKLPYKLFDTTGKEVNIGKPQILPYDNDESYHPEIRNNILCPVGIYVEKALPYGVQLIGSGGILWTQPILTLLNRYPNASVNEWDGTTLTIDDENGAILATAIAAGKKESWEENKQTFSAFTGVMLGDWQQNGDSDASISKNTGIYGFHRGQMAYSFKDDGTAFIGKSGRGRIYFDGNSGSIKSSMWDEKNQGLCLDVDDGKLDMIMLAGYAKVALPEKSKLNTYYEYRDYQKATTWNEKDIYYKQNNSGSYSLIGTLTEEEFNTPNMVYYISIDEYVKTTDIEINESKTYYIKTSQNRYISLTTQDTLYPLSIGAYKTSRDRSFKVEWDGTCHIGNGYFYGSIDASSGSIGGWSIFGDYLMSNDGRTKLDGREGTISTEYFIARHNNNNLGEFGYIQG
jgi:hypothetical protein